MYIHGEFVNKTGSKVGVEILTHGDKSEELVVAGDEWGKGALFFPSEGAVTIKDETNDTFDHLLRQSCTITLMARDVVRELFCTSCRDAVVNVRVNGRLVFAGYLEPQTYSQGYNELYDDVELNCVDALSALQYQKYRNIGTLGVSYTLVKRKAAVRTFEEIVREIMEGVTEGLVISGDEAAQFLYDGSKRISKNDESVGILAKIGISELMMLGDDEDDVWQQDETVEEILRYLNLHIRQEGMTFYVFSWETAVSGKNIEWKPLWDTTAMQLDATAVQSHTIAVSGDNVADMGTKISIGEVYNQISLTDKTDAMDSVVENPLDSLVPAFTSMQKYMTEYISEGEGVKATKAFYAMTHGEATDFGDASMVDWFVRIKKNVNWTFPMADGTDAYAHYAKDGKHQERMLMDMGFVKDVGGTPTYQGNVRAAIVGFGSHERKQGNVSDNTPTTSVSLTDYLVVSVNGNCSDTENTAKPTAEALLGAIPVARYVGNAAGGMFSPADDETTNYIAITGKMILNPSDSRSITDYYKRLHEATGWGKKDGAYWHKTVPSRNNGDGRYYTTQWFEAEHPSDTPTWINSCAVGLMPYTGQGKQEMDYNYSGIGDSSDTISKLGVLACMLRIGDKVAVEKRDTDGLAWKGTDGTVVSDFEWKTYKSREQCQGDDEYYQQCFYIGIDPKVGDKIIGSEFDVQRNHDYTIGLEEDGMLIPIRKGDKVSGQVTFEILGPVNSVWNQVTRRHPSFWRHTKWGENAMFVLAHTSAIFIKDFEVKVVSDGNTASGEDKDIVYVSDTKETFTNKKDDIEFRITTALTSAEARRLGVNSGVWKSSPIDMRTGDSLLSIYDASKDEAGKPEQLYVDSYYKEWHEPRIELEQTLRDGDMRLSFLDHILHPALGKEMYVTSLGHDLHSGEATVRAKEIYLNNE